MYLLPGYTTQWQGPWLWAVTCHMSVTEEQGVWDEVSTTALQPATPSRLNMLCVVVRAGKEEPQLRRLLNENEEVARQRDSLKKRLQLMQRAAEEIMHFRV